jgi:RNA polymerase sigma-70 factor (ECF subfamily)
MENINYSSKTDEEIAELVLLDQEVFAHLITRYEKKLLNYIKRLSNFSQEEAEDLLQDTFIKVYRNINSFDKSLKFSSWIYRIAHNQIIDRHRHLKRRPEYYSVADQEKVFQGLSSDNDLVADLDQSYLRKTIYSVFDKMDEKYKEVLILKYFEEKDYEEISDILKKPMGTVATLLNRAKKEFRKELEKSKIKI